jgi:hypothetical protein
MTRPGRPDFVITSAANFRVRAALELRNRGGRAAARRLLERVREVQDLGGLLRLRLPVHRRQVRVAVPELNLTPTPLPEGQGGRI